jgi:hypothetical protein
MAIEYNLDCGAVMKGTSVLVPYERDCALISATTPNPCPCTVANSELYSRATKIHQLLYLYF